MGMGDASWEEMDAARAAVRSAGRSTSVGLAVRGAVYEAAADDAGVTEVLSAARCAQSAVWEAAWKDGAAGWHAGDASAHYALTDEQDWQSELLDRLLRGEWPGGV